MYKFSSYLMIIITYSCLSLSIQGGTCHHFGQLSQYKSASTNHLHSLIDIMISIEVYRMRIGLHYSRQAKVKGIAHLNFFELLIVLSLLFIGGIERNPGPPSSSSEDSISLYPQLNISLKINFPLYTIMFRVLRIK